MDADLTLTVSENLSESDGIPCELDFDYSYKKKWREYQEQRKGDTDTLSTDSVFFETEISPRNRFGTLVDFNRSPWSGPQLADWVQNTSSLPNSPRKTLESFEPLGMVTDTPQGEWKRSLDFSKTEGFGCIHCEDHLSNDETDFYIIEQSSPSTPRLACTPPLGFKSSFVRQEGQPYTHPEPKYCLCHCQRNYSSDSVTQNQPSSKILSPKSVWKSVLSKISCLSRQSKARKKSKFRRRTCSGSSRAAVPVDADSSCLDPIPPYKVRMMYSWRACCYTC